MRKKLFALALMIALIGLTTPVAVHDANAASCTREGLPSVQVTVDISPIHTNTTQNLAQLTGRDNNTRLGIMDGHHVGGLTVGDIQAQTQVGFGESTGFFTGNTCLWVQSLVVQLNLQSKIFVAKELQRGTCQYRILLEHEQKHVQIDRNVVNEYRRLIEAHLESELLQQGAAGPVPFRLAPDLQRDLTGRVSGIVDEQMRKLYAERDRRQQALDNPQEYERMSMACL
tara:strand:+ start:127 stop:810 length:684 start_codon:yes stop_codon:yes gene_type:complete